MNIVKSDINNINRKDQHESNIVRSMATRMHSGVCKNMEVSVKNSLIAAMLILTAAAVVAIGMVGLGSKARTVAEPAYDANGMMREVVVVAQSPRLVMPTVHISAARAFASLPIPSELN